MSLSYHSRKSGSCTIGDNHFETRRRPRNSVVRQLPALSTMMLVLSRPRTLSFAVVTLLIARGGSSSCAREVTLAWDAVESGGVEGYRLYYGLQSRQYVWSVDAGPHTWIHLKDLKLGATYYLAVTAYGDAGRIESGYSREVVTRVTTIMDHSRGSFRREEAASSVEGGAYHAESVVILPDYAVSFVFTGPRRMLVTQKGGFGGRQSASVWIVKNERLADEPLITFEDVQTLAEMGLRGITLDPDYEKNRFVYVFYTHQPSGTNRVVRVKDAGAVVQHGEAEVLVEFPATTCGNHQGGVLEFGADGMLYVGAGDGGCEPCASQDKTVWAGKILRFTADGGIPEDNPFSGSPVFAFGVQNALDLTFDPTNGDLFATEGGMGVQGEINRIRSGRNYGGAQFQCGERVTLDCSALGAANSLPVQCYGRGVVPTGIVLYSGGRYPVALEGSLIFGDSRNGTLHRMGTSIDGEQISEAGHEFMMGFDPIMDLAVSPDGFLHVLTEREILKVIFSDRE